MSGERTVEISREDVGQFVNEYLKSQTPEVQLHNYIADRTLHPRNPHGKPMSTSSIKDRKRKKRERANRRKGRR